MLNWPKEMTATSSPGEMYRKERGIVCATEAEITDFNTATLDSGV